MPADLILFALIAAGLIFWLRSILGSHDEDDLENKKPTMFSEDDKNLKQKKDGNVVALNASASMGDQFVLPRHVRVDNKTTENRLDEISRNHPNFDLGHFVQGAEAAFGIIVEAFANNDLDTLKDLLAPEVYQAFESAVHDRIERGDKVETEIKAIEKMDIIDAAINDDHVFITVRFSARETCVIRNNQGDILSGDPDSTTMMVDVWVFGREVNSEGPEWYLYETRDDEIEGHKTPLPEGGSDKKKK